jgi:hypothetical protein
VAEKPGSTLSHPQSFKFWSEEKNFNDKFNFSVTYQMKALHHK